jgi:lipopolysaccharide/colanic/teichoic acid biosynthesis glycosyltransferase
MYLYIKRFFDFIFSLLFVIILLPVFIPIIIALSLTAEGYIFYKQQRVGYKNNFFEIYKFATMLKNSPNMLTGSLTLRNDPRVTPIGKYLRITKINELPQLLNVLKGDMSIVGPRPQMKVDFDVYSEEVKKKICNTLPGITGIGSIVFRDEENLISESKRSAKDFYADTIAPYKGELELWYQTNISFYTDIKIIILTAWVIISPKSNMVYKFFPTLPKRRL